MPYRSTRGGQEILERSAVVFDEESLEVRIGVQLPAAGRRIRSERARAILTEAVERVTLGSVVSHDPPERASRHVRSIENHRSIQRQLVEQGLIAFVADGSILPRASGRDDRPPLGSATAFRSPPSLTVEMRLVDGDCITGMGLPRGISLIAGGGYHGKTTLLRAIELGVYAHVPGDGRELVVTHPEAVKIRAENGRPIACVDISPFIGAPAQFRRDGRVCDVECQRRHLAGREHRRGARAGRRGLAPGRRHLRQQFHVSG